MHCKVVKRLEKTMLESVQVAGSDVLIKYDSVFKKKGRGVEEKVVSYISRARGRTK